MQTDVPNQLECKILRISRFVIDVPVEAVFKADVVDFDVQLEGPYAASLQRLVGAVARYCLPDGVLDLALEVGQSRVLRDDQMGELLRSEVGVIDIPAELLLVPFALQLQIEMNRDQDLLPFIIALSHYVGRRWGEHELFVDGLVESGIPRPSGVETVEPLSERILNLDVVPLDLALEPEGEGGVVDACFPGHVHLLYVVFR